MTETPDQIAARLYPEEEISVPDEMFEGGTLLKWRVPTEKRAAYLTGDAAGYARAIEKAAQIADNARLGDNGLFGVKNGIWAVHEGACIEIAAAIRALSPTSPAPDKE